MVLFSLQNSMKKFLKETISGKQFELTIDTQIFSKDIILKAAYNFLDKGYFFFSLDTDKNIILQFTLKDGVDQKADKIIWEFSDELLDVYLRDKLERDNKVIRETIVTKAINGPFDTTNFVTFDSWDDNREQNQIDFDKDIDEILKEIEEDPDLQIDEQEIENILREIEEETQMEAEKPSITVDPDSIQSAKDSFKSKK